jgi:signal transduction histidine kinase
MKFLVTTLCILVLHGLLYSATANSAQLVLGANEKQWLTEHPIIRLSPNPAFSPIEAVITDGEYVGIAADYLALIERKINFEFTVVGYPSWKQVIEQTKQKNVDVLAAVARSTQREAYLNFTTAHIKLPGMIIVSDRTSGAVTVNDLKNMKVAAPTGSVWFDLISNDHPDIKLLEAANLKQGLQDLSSGILDAVVADPATVTQVINEEGLSNLRIGGETGYFFNLAFAVRKDWPVLRDILDKSIQSISDEEHQVILDKWIKIKIETGISNDVIIGLAIGVFVLVVLIVGFIIMKVLLRIRMAQQTGELDEANARLAEINTELEQRLTEQNSELEKARVNLETSQVKMAQSEKMAALGQMIAGIANEINTPLGYSRSNVLIMQEFVARVRNIETTFTTWKNLVNDGLTSDSDISNKFDELNVIFSEMTENDEIEECDELATDTLYGLDQIAEITQNLKEFSRLDQAETADVNLNHNIERTLKLAKNLLKDHIIVELSLGQIPLIECNSSKINQVLLNLITNACHAINVSGKEIGKLAINSDFDGDRVNISIKDNGVGIAQDVGKKIFDPFYTTRGDDQGTGLGLSISNNIIVKEHGGKISVHTRENVGTKITISLSPQNGLSPE